MRIDGCSARAAERLCPSGGALVNRSLPIVELCKRMSYAREIECTYNPCAILRSRARDAASFSKSSATTCHWLAQARPQASCVGNLDQSDPFVAQELDGFVYARGATRLMPLTVVIGSSGSGKTTFLENVHKLNKGVYIRQYHMIRPYIPVCKIPGFDPSKLPFWNLYADEEMRDGDACRKNPSYNPKVKVGGTMAGEFTPGLSGGQRKMLLFELVSQRIAGQEGLLICLDEPFCGVTDNFVPFIVERLNEMGKKHSVLLVTNDHVQALTDMADSTITVSALDRSKVTVNKETCDRQLALHAAACGKSYEHHADGADLWFFLDTEIFSNSSMAGIVIFSMLLFGLFVPSFWDSGPESEPLLILAIQLISFFSIQPYLAGISDWRNTMIEEAEALMHASVHVNKFLKAFMVSTLIALESLAAFTCLLLVTDELKAAEYWSFLFFDSASLTLPFIFLGLYTSLPHQTVEVLAALPTLLLIFFSTTFSPGAGVEGVKFLRYLFTRFYFWCKLPVVKGRMEGCPPDDTLVWFATLTGFLSLAIFLLFQTVRWAKNVKKQTSEKRTRANITTTRMRSFTKIQQELTGISPDADVELAQVDATDGEGMTAQLDAVDGKGKTKERRRSLPTKWRRALDTIDGDVVADEKMRALPTHLSNRRKSAPMIFSAVRPPPRALVAELASSTRVVDAELARMDAMQAHPSPVNASTGISFSTGGRSLSNF